MNGCDFFDDQPPTGALPRWATITQVSTFLEVPRNAVRSAVRRAVANSELWVKKATSQEGKPISLIDTEHEIYKTHEERWLHHPALPEDALPASGVCESHARLAPPSPRHQGKRALSPSVSRSYAHVSNRHDAKRAFASWPRLRQWLYGKGLQIFQNELDEEARTLWRWRWDELEGAGCHDVEEALVMALQSRFHVDRENLFEALTQEGPLEMHQNGRLEKRRYEAPSRRIYG